MRLQELLKVVRKELKPSLQKHLYGILTYGSAAREEDYTSGWSDVDLLIVPNYSFVCPREFYEELASWYTRVRETLEKSINWGIEEEVNFSIYDIGSLSSLAGIPG